MALNIHIDSPKVKYTEDYIESEYEYQTANVLKDDTDKFTVKPVTTKLLIRTQIKVPKLGVMLVGLGGNNGTTITAALLANKHKLTWETKTGIKKANWYGSLLQASTVKLGSKNNQDVFVPMSSMLPMVNPNDIEIDGWDISSMNLADAMERAKVIDINLQKQLKPYMIHMKPRKSIYYPDFIASNQKDRADNVIQETKLGQLTLIRKDIAEFKTSKNLDQVIVLWTANTERFSTINPGVNDTADNLLKAINENHPEISPSTMFAVAAALEGCTYINGSPQNTFVPGAIELAERQGTFIGGDDFKSGQTKLKSVLVDFLVSAGIKPVSIVSYNHLGNNDGYNLSAPQQFRSKEISKSNVVDDMVQSNQILYEPGEKPDHCVVIKYVPYVGDSKRAMDEYMSEIMLGGHNTIVVHNTCEDSLLASPIILDLVLLAELCSRITFRHEDEGEEESRRFAFVWCHKNIFYIGANVLRELTLKIYYDIIDIIKMNKYLQLATVGTNYANRMNRLSNRIFGEVVRPTNQKSLKVVQLFSEKPVQKRTEIVDYYPRHRDIHKLMLHLRDYGLFRDEHEDFREEYDRLRELRGKKKWIPPPLRK